MKNLFLKISLGLGAIVFLTPLLFAYNEFDLIKVSILKSLLSIVFFIYILHTFWGDSRYLNNLKAKISFLFSETGKKIGLLFGLLFLYFIANTLLALNMNISLWGSHSRQFGLLSVFFYFIFGSIIFFYIEKYYQIKNIIKTILFSSFFVSAYGLIQFSSLDLIKWKETSRIFSTLGQPNFLGHFLLFVIPITIWAIIFLIKNNILKILAIALLGMQLSCLFLTYSRSSYISLFLGIFFSSLFLLYTHKKRKIFLYTILSSFILFLIILSINVFNLNINNKNSKNYFVNRVVSLVDFNSWQAGSMKIRIEYWKAVKDEFKNASWNRRMFGYGMDNTGIVLGTHYKKDWGIYESLNSFPDRAHNVFLDIWLNFGLIGLFLIGLIFFSFSRLLWEYFKDNNLTDKYFLVFALSVSMLMHFIHNLFQFSSVTDFVYLSLYIGLILNIIYSSKTYNTSVEVSNLWFNFSNIFKAIITSLLLLLLIILNYFNFNLLYSTMHVARAEEVASYNCLYTLDGLNKAMQLAPFDAYYKERYIWHGINCFHKIEDNETKQQVEDNIIFVIEDFNINNSSYSVKLNIATAYGLFAKNPDSVYYKKADELYKNLIKNYPDVFTSYKRFAMFNFDFGNLKLAKDNLKKALKVLPDTQHSLLNKEHRDLILYETNRMNNLMTKIK